jgi:hypothetical protein
MQAKKFFDHSKDKRIFDDYDEEIYEIFGMNSKRLKKIHIQSLDLLIKRFDFLLK